jgi:hypothetical protein
VGTIIRMPGSGEGQIRDQVVSERELAECVALENEINCLRTDLWRRRAELRSKLQHGMEVEDGPLTSFAAWIARAGKRRSSRWI